MTSLNVDSTDAFVFDSSTPPEQIGAFFDVDETLVRGATAYWAAKEMFRRSFFGARELAYAARHALLYVLFGENKDKIAILTDKVMGVVEGSSLEDLQQIGEDLYENYFVPKVYRATYDRLREHIEAGHQVYLVSATPWLIAEEIARRLGAAGGLGTRGQVLDGFLGRGLDGGLLHGEAKVTAVMKVAKELNLDLDASWAYSDSASDIPMLSLVGHPVAVNPDRVLRSFAKVKGWPVLSAFERIDLIKRRAARTALALGAVAGAVILYKVTKRGGSAFLSFHRSAPRPQSQIAE